MGHPLARPKIGYLGPRHQGRLSNPLPDKVVPELNYHRDKAPMAMEQNQHSPEDIRALQDASASRALSALANALEKGTLVKNREGNKELFVPHTTR
jgi:hypothetical protein